jgi:hypothetical protein
MDSELVRKRSELPVTDVMDELRDDDRDDRPEDKGDELKLFLLSIRSPA